MKLATISATVVEKLHEELNIEAPELKKYIHEVEERICCLEILTISIEDMSQLFKDGDLQPKQEVCKMWCLWKETNGLKM